MAIVSLLKPPKEQLFDFIYRENQELREFPLDWHQLGDPVVQHAARTKLTVIGDAGKHNEPRLSGIRNVFYTRVDLEQLLQRQKPLIVYGASTKRALLVFMAAQWGIELNPELVVDGPLDPLDAVTTLTFQNHELLIVQDSVEIHYVWSDLTDVSALLTTPNLAGYDLPWPYPEYIATKLTVSELSGYALPSIVMWLPEVSRYWAVEDTTISQWLSERIVSGPYSPNTLTLAVSMASGGTYQWQCVDNENTPYNLWGSEIVYNGPSEGPMASLYSQVLRLRTNSTYMHQGLGDILIHYNN